MITTAKASQKSLNQYIEMYQMSIDFELEKIWVQVQLKFNKADSDQMFDDINDKLIQVCDKYIQENNIGWDKFQLATVVMKLFTQAASECEAPFKVVVKENKKQIQEYLEKNKEKRETLERIKKENKELDKRVAKELAQRKVIKESVAEEKEEIIAQPIAPTQTPAPQKKAKPKQKFNWDAYSVSTTFTF